MSIIYLLRHGEIPQSSPRRFVGQRDLPLTATGRNQMAALAERFADKGLERIVCSPLSRCVESATGDWARIFAAVIIVFLPTFVLYLFLSEKIIAGITAAS